MEYWKIQLTAGVVGIVFALIAWRITSSATGALTPGGGPVATGGVPGAAFEGSYGGATIKSSSPLVALFIVFFLCATVGPALYLYYQDKGKAPATDDTPVIVKTYPQPAVVHLHTIRRVEDEDARRDQMTFTVFKSPAHQTFAVDMPGFPSVTVAMWYDRTSNKLMVQYPMVAQSTPIPWPINANEADPTGVILAVPPIATPPPAIVTDRLTLGGTLLPSAKTGPLVQH